VPTSHRVQIIAQAGEVRPQLSGALYNLGGYQGQLDLGLSITGLRGGHTSTRLGRPFAYLDHEPYEADVYPRTERVAAGELLDPAPVVLRMLRHLLEATTGDENHNPFE
jgi:hypothetical protein